MAREYADAGLPTAALEERLTMTGTKVEAVHHHGVDALERFVIGRVLEAGRHPDADRLQRVHWSTSATAARSRSCAARPTSRPGRSWPSRGRAP